MELYIDFIQIWTELYSLLLLPFLWAHTRALVRLKGSITNFNMRSKYLKVNRISNNHKLFWLLERVKRTHYMKSTVRSCLLHPCIPGSILYFFTYIRLTEALMILFARQRSKDLKHSQFILEMPSQGLGRRLP